MSICILIAYMRKRGDAGDIITANFLDFPPNFRLRTQFQAIFRPFQAILGHFRPFIGQIFAILGNFRPFLEQIFRQFFFAKKAITATQVLFSMYALYPSHNILSCKYPVLYKKQILITIITLNMTKMPGTLTWLERQNG